MWDLIHVFLDLSESIVHCSVAQSCPGSTLFNLMDCRTPDFPVFHYLLGFSRIHVHWVNSVIQPSHPLSPPLSSCPQRFSASGSFPMNWLFTTGGQRIRASASASASVLPMNIELISFRTDWFDLVVQETLNNLLQYHSSKVSILWHSVFFMVQLSHPYVTTGNYCKLY